MSINAKSSTQMNPDQLQKLLKSINKIECGLSASFLALAEFRDTDTFNELVWIQGQIEKIKDGLKPSILL
jgi:aspartyl/asparaginyl beta-hydroxylase (cupin superfamily)